MPTSNTSKKTHKIKAGDWLGTIAAEYGLRRAMSLWDAPENESLRARRGSPDVLALDDELVVPEHEPPPSVDVAAGQRVTLVARRSLDRLRLRVRDVAPLIAVFEHVDYVLEVGGDRHEGQIVENDQLLEVPLPSSARTATLTLMGTIKREFHIGGLGPADEQRGAVARIVNLGYAQDGDEEPEPRSIIAAFQSWMNMVVSGELDDATIGALEAAYSPSEGDST